MKKINGKLLFQYSLGILLDVLALGFLIYQLSSQIIMEKISSKTSATQSIQLKQEKDPDLQLVLNILDNIEKGKTSEALDLCYRLGLSESASPKIVEYFADFYEYYFVTNNPDSIKNCEITTSTFLKNAHYLEDFFKTSRFKDSWIGFAEIIPYYFISNFNSKSDIKQKEQYQLYKEYVETICEQNEFVSNRTADVICLYINARYYTINTKTNSELKTLVQEIEHFQEIYPNQLGESGTLRLQRDYLKIVKDYLITQIDAPFRLKPKWNRDFPGYKL